MFMQLIKFSILLTANLLPAVQSAALPAKTLDTDSLVLMDEEFYSFEQFLSDFSRYYDNRDEYLERERIFYENLRKIVAHNRNQEVERSRNVSYGHYWMGVSQWADRAADELFRGYDKHQSEFVRSVSSDIASAHRQLRWSSAKDLSSDVVSQSFAEKVGLTIDSVDDLPKFVDWRMKGVTTPVKLQGMCGSCWAFASTAVLESHIAIQTGFLFELSTQQIVSCTKNPFHCGGSGGCTGATAELAFNHVREFGAVQEWQYGYQDSEGLPLNCSLLSASIQNNREEKFFHSAVAGLSEYVTLPSNNYTILMNVVAKIGPVAVSVACLPWHLYKSGVFYEPMSNDSTSSTDLNHLVVLEGYGTDKETGEDFWIVRNSWGPQWGEHGYIRLRRIGDSECAIDKSPSNGIGCALDPYGKSVVPPSQKICGNSGILFDSVIPLGVFLINK
jgi:cathepsin L